MLCGNFGLICQMLLKEDFKIYQCIFSNILLLAFPYEIFNPPLAWALIPFTQVCFVPKLFEIDPKILKKRM